MELIAGINVTESLHQLQCTTSTTTIVSRLTPENTADRYGLQLSEVDRPRVADDPVCCLQLSKEAKTLCC